MSHFIKLVFVIFVSVYMMLGCAKPVTSGIGSSPMTVSDNYQAHLKLDNPKLAKKLQITNIITRKNNDLLQLNLELSSKYKKSQTLQYHFEWFDDQGFAVEAGKAPWKPLDLHGFAVINLDALAPSVRASKFKVYVREVSTKAQRF
ncbi:YcfL family protein [Pseudoalteromonas sp. C2R02]|uniref:YcfL family protein n=1 Tax=Pseudoalteromonas sp. C2R02 TaxID=2841565 RepID=UPI00209170E5|nr:YcfL family protein [Pseudoalteromonas sp. C2R02]